MFGSLGGPELLIILAIVVVLFGASRIAGLGSSLGAAIREFKREVKEPGDEKGKTTLHSEAEPQQPTSTASSRPDDKPSFRH